MNIEENLNGVRARIAAAASAAGRCPEDIKLIAVTKTYPIELMNRAIELGVTDIGENKPQEVRDKFEHVLPVRWHLIGHLQTNKVKYVIDRCCMIHSVDSIKLMDEIDRLAVSHERDPEILIEVNISGEESKSGIAASELEGLLRHAAELKRTKVRGLMTVAPKEGAEKVFADMQSLYNEMKGKSFKNVSMDELSMGMSGDFETAIKYGATMVRIGTLIFGARDYTK